MCLMRSVESPAEVVKRHQFPMQYCNSPYQFTRSHQMRQSWREFWAILRLLNRHDELQRLVRWAKRKRLAGPRKCYKSHLEDMERRLFRYRVESPATVRKARCLQLMKRVLFRPPRYPAKGAALGYSRKQSVKTAKLSRTCYSE